MLRLSPQQVVGGLNRKESKAITWIFETYYPSLCNIVRKLTNFSADAEDLVSDSFVALLAHPGPFETVGKIRYFLYATMRNTCMDYLRHQQVKKNNQADVILFYQSLEEQQMEAAEFHNAFHALIDLAVENLPRKCRQVFLFSYVDGLKNKEIAHRLGISEKTVLNHKAYAYKLLKMKMDESGNASLSGLLGLLLL